jgi:hypothetical protein
MLRRTIFSTARRSIYLSVKPDILPDDLRRVSMKTMILAAIAALSLSAAALPAFANSTVSGDRQATRMQQTGSYSE